MPSTPFKYLGIHSKISLKNPDVDPQNVFVRQRYGDDTLLLESVVAVVDMASFPLERARVAEGSDIPQWAYHSPRGKAIESRSEEDPYCTTIRP
jgi:hypothetical protein